MADLSFSFNPADIATASDAASRAMSKIGAGSAVWDLDATSAISAVAARSAAWDGAAAAASDAASKAGVAVAAASDAASKVTALDGTVIKSVPGTNSFAVHEILRTSAGLVKFVYSSAAA